MLTSADCVKKYGKPDIAMERAHMELWVLPEGFVKAIPELPSKLYCNKDIIQPLWQAITNVIKRDLTCHINSWEGCFNIRLKKGGNSWSLHSWGVAIDFNAATNAFGAEPQMPIALVECFTDAGFDWGGTWTKKDGMHFQLSEI
jgi:hypothetical protein